MRSLTDRGFLFWVIFGIVIFVIVAAILMIYHQEIVACDKGDLVYHTTFPESAIEDPQQMPTIGAIVPSNWTYPANYVGSQQFEHSKGRYKVFGRRVLRQNWDVKTFVKMRVEATFEQLGKLILIFVDDLGGFEEVSFSTSDMEHDGNHSNDKAYGFDIRRDSKTHDVVVRRLYNGGDIHRIEDISKQVRVSRNSNYVLIAIEDSTIVDLSIFWTDEVPGIPGILGFK